MKKSTKKILVFAFILLFFLILLVCLYRYCSSENFTSPTCHNTSQQCVASCRPFGCSDTNQCQPGQICQNGTCVCSTQASCSSYCRSGSCPTGLTCYNGGCICFGCPTGCSCPPGMTCNNGRCTCIAGGPCSTQCPCLDPRQTCVEGKCERTLESLCVQGEIFQDGKCISCTCSTGCPLGVSATGYICVDGAPIREWAYGQFSGTMAPTGSYDIWREVNYATTVNTLLYGGWAIFGVEGVKSWPNLVYAGHIGIHLSNVYGIEAPLLQKINSFYVSNHVQRFFQQSNSVEGAFLSNIPHLSKIHFPSLTTIYRGFRLGGDYAGNEYHHVVEEVYLPKIEYIGIDSSPGPYFENVNVGTQASSTSIRISQRYGNITLKHFRFGSDDPNDDGFRPSNLKRIDGDVIIRGILTQSSVDNILFSLASLDGTQGTTPYIKKVVDLRNIATYMNLQNSQVPVRASPPSARGQTYKDILISRGCTVLTN